MKKILTCGLLVFLLASCDGGSSDTSPDSDNVDSGSGVNDTGNGSDSGGGNPGGDSDTGSSGNDTGTEVDTDKVQVDSNGVHVAPPGAEIYDTDTSVNLDTDFDVSGVDLTLGGMLPDVPEPVYDCMDPHMKQNCVSLSVVWKGIKKQFLILGDDLLYVSTISLINSDFAGYGLQTSMLGDWPEYLTFFDISVHVEKWKDVPSLFDVVTTPATDPPTLYFDFSFPFEADGTAGYGGGTSTTDKGLNKARMAGWVVHTGDFKKKEKMFVAKFAASWTFPLDDGSITQVAYKGTMKGYN